MSFDAIDATVIDYSYTQQQSISSEITPIGLTGIATPCGSCTPDFPDLAIQSAAPLGLGEQESVSLLMLEARQQLGTGMLSVSQAQQAPLYLLDASEESANLLALKTRQQLGIQSLSFAGQQEQAILRLF